MTGIRWIGGLALLAVAGVAVLLATANAQSVPVLGATIERDLTTSERTTLGTIVAPCWPGSIANAQSVVIQRGRGPDVARVYQIVSGTRVLTAPQALAVLQTGQMVRGGRIVDEVVKCEISLPNANLTTFASATWPFPLSTLREIVVWRRDDGVIRVIGRGAQDLNSTQVDAELVAGRAVIPLGVYEQ